jgi:hypothetical protein
MGTTATDSKFLDLLPGIARHICAKHIGVLNYVIRNRLPYVFHELNSYSGIARAVIAREASRIAHEYSIINKRFERRLNMLFERLGLNEKQSAEAGTAIGASLEWAEQILVIPPSRYDELYNETVDMDTKEAQHHFGSIIRCDYGIDYFIKKLFERKRRKT